METGMRGYMLSGQEEFLEPYLARKTNFFEGIAALQVTVGDNAPQVERLGHHPDLGRQGRRAGLCATPPGE